MFTSECIIVFGAFSAYRWYSSASNLTSRKRHLRRSRIGRDEVSDDLLKCFIGLLGDLAILCDGGEQALVAGLDVCCELLLEGSNLAGVQFVQVATDAAVDDGDLLYSVLTLIMIMTKRYQPYFNTLIT